MPGSLTRNPSWEVHMMKNQKRRIGKTAVATALWAVLALGWIPGAAQQAAPRDPAEPARGKPQPKILARPAGTITRPSGDKKAMRAATHPESKCGTPLRPTSW